MRETTEKVMHALSEAGPKLKDNSKQLYEIIDELILPHFDFRRMSSWVLGKHWRVASDEQKKAFTEEFQALLVRTYSRALVDYRDKRIQFLATRVRTESDVTVRAEIDQGGGPPIPVTYEVSLVDGVWKVYDVAVNGVSLVINYRSSFNSEIQRNGLDGLIQRLKDRNEQQSA